jgi:hypothetical protein
MRALLVLLLVLVPRLAAAGDDIVLTVHVAAAADGTPVSDAAWIDAEVATATERLGPAGVRFARADAADGAQVPAAIATVADRDALAALVDGGSVHVFVVDTLADKDKQGGTSTA